MSHENMPRDTEDVVTESSSEGIVTEDVVFACPLFDRQYSAVGTITLAIANANRRLLVCATTKFARNAAQRDSYRQKKKHMPITPAANLTACSQSTRSVR
ncbi:uncharacterized protein N7473_013248 [Penicillium subrubescens]|uniref:uncharacterized protein n=1 Tax=Penicillium subrubescens TaxID=1316194 RepID=UPI0025454A98|nr:uncharacterized protein N7473_013248 [Penicillium subrubescens]KAJ5873689.1 hypothetical protein N7473_013248 [Penicillium subrubescens]